MANLRQAAQQALRALLTLAEHDQRCDVFDLDDEGKHKECSCGFTNSITALRAALAEPEQKPVAWMQEMPVSGNEERSVRMTTVKMVADGWENPIPLYTTPPQRKPLRKDVPVIEFLKDDSK